MNESLIEEYSLGIDHYYAGVLPQYWDSTTARLQSPYLSGWYHASLLDLGIIQDEDEPCVDCGWPVAHCTCGDQDDNDY